MDINKTNTHGLSSSISTSTPTSTPSVLNNSNNIIMNNNNNNQLQSSLMISIKVSIVDLNVTKTLQFNSSILVYDALKIIREKIPETNTNNASDYGIFIPNSDPSKGVWLENGRTLDYYMLKNGDAINYCNKFRKLHIKMLDGQSGTLLVDDSQTVAQLMIYICSKLGIANYEEYSLIHDIPESEKEKTMTLKKQDKNHRDFKKMEELKKKLHTDDDIAWLDHSKTLRQQHIDESSTLILKRKFFFSDKNIDTRDPIQLNLLYVQCRDAIINGTHPINEEEAIKFAALQCQVKYGDYSEHAFKSGCLDLKDYLPKEYVKVKGIEKKITQEYKTLTGLKELEAKLKYTQLCRSLKTYGVTFFLVKEKMKGKNKLVARLLGITKESIVRVDEKTKEFLNVYPLECVKKWAASPNTFTLDFGDHYKEPYYSMQTTEGEHIARLISGYIDIILKKKKSKEFNGSDANEELPMLEEIVTPSKATVIQMNKTNLNQVVSGNVILPGILRNGQVENSNSFSSGTINLQNSAMSRPAIVGYTGDIHNSGNHIQYNDPISLQKPLITTIQNARSIINVAQNNLHQRPIIADIGNDPASLQWKINMIDVNKQNVTSHLSAMNASTAQVVTLTSNGPQNTDFNAVGAAVSSISTNLGDFSKDIMMIAALQDDKIAESDRLLDAAKKLCSAFSDFLRHVEPDCNEPRQNMFSAVGKIGEIGNEIVRNINREENLDDTFRMQETFIGLAKLVASATAGLVIASKNVANHCGNQQGVNEVISLVTQCALSTSQLVSCTKVCSSTISSRECQEQIVEAARQVSRQVDGVMDVANLHCQNEQALSELAQCAQNVTASVMQLLDNVKASDEQIINIRSNNNALNKQDEAIERIFNATDMLFNSVGNGAEMIRQAKIVAQSTTELINSLKQEAHVQPTSEQQRKLLLAAKLLAEATSKIVEAAKGCASNPTDERMQSSLKKAAEDLKNATTVAAGDNLQSKLIKRLELCAKQVASCATQSIAAIQVCTLSYPTEDQSNLRNQTHNQLIQQCKEVADYVPKIVQSIRGCMVNPQSKSAHLALINSCDDFIQPTQKMIGLSKAVLPTIIDEIKAIQLRNCTNQLNNAVNDLKNYLAKIQEVCGSFEADAMIESIHMLDQELIEIKKAALMSTLKPLPGENLEICEAQLAAVSKNVGLSMAQMLTAAAQGNEVYTGIASKDTLNSLRSFTSSIRAIAACSSNNRSYQEKLIESACLVLQQSIGLVNESRLALQNPNDSIQNQQRLAQIARTIAQSLYECVNCLPGQKDIDEVIKSITEYSSILFNHPINYPKSNKSLEELQLDLNQSALSLNQSTNQICIDSRKGSQHLSQSTFKFSSAFGSFIQTSLTICGQFNIDKERLIETLKDVYANSNKLLQSAKSCVADPNASSSRQQLAISVKNVTQNINNVINICIENNNPILVAQKECDNALRDIETTRTIVQTHNDIDNYITEPVSYYDCLDQIIEQSRLLGESMTGIANNCKNPCNPEQFSKSIRDTSKSICGLVETAAHSAYIIGISDIESKRGRPAILDTTHFINCSQRIQDTCADLQSMIAKKNGSKLNNEEQKKLIHSATQIAHSTASLCNASQQASSKTTNILAKRHFVQSAKQVANATANFVKSIKSLDYNNEHQNNGVEFRQDTFVMLVKPLLESVDSLCQYSLSPEFASVPAIISENGAKAQEPILFATRSMLDASSHLVQASRSLISNNMDPHSWQLFSTNSKLISDSIKRLATAIKEKAPAKSECDQAIMIIDKCMKHLEGALLAITMNQHLPLSELANSKSLQAYQEHAISCANQIMELVDQLRIAAKGEADKLGHLVTEISQYFEPLVVNVIGCAAKTQFNSQQQTAFLEQTKTVLESSFQLMIVSKESGGNPKNTSNLHQAIDENSDGTKEVLDDLIQTLEEATVQNGYMFSMMDNINRAMTKVDLNNRNISNASTIELIQTGERGKQSTDSSQQDFLNTDQQIVDEDLDDNQKQLIFLEYQTKIVLLSKTMTQNIKDMTTCNLNELGQFAQQLTQTFNYLILACKGSMNTCINRDVTQRIKITTQDLGKSCIDLVDLAGRLQQNTNDKMLRKDFLDQTEIVNKRLNNLLHSFQTNAKGTQACINADSYINGIVADLNTVIMFATAGTLKSETDIDSFGNHRELILRSAKTLVEDTKSLVSISGQQKIDQENLANGVQTSIKTITKLSDAIKLGAASLGCEQPDAQVLLINSVKDVASALSDLIATIKLVSTGLTRNMNNNKMNSNGLDYSASLLSESAKNMITNVQSLLKTVKSVEDEASRGTRALESAIEAIYQEIKTYSSYINENYKEDNNQNNVNTNPEDLIKSTKQITLATSKAIGASNSMRQEDIIAAANMGRKVVSDLLLVCRGAMLKALKNDEKNRQDKNADDFEPEPKQILSVGINCAIFYKELLECIQNILNKSSVNENKQNLIAYSKKVANSVSEILEVAEMLKGSEWMDPEDPTYIAENELLGAANAIESAAKKLSVLKPRPKTETVSENLNFDEQILEAAKSITNAAGVLIKAATSAQQELIAQGKFQPINSNNNNEDGQWSQGLISAARMVAAACHALCEAANGLVQGHATEERLISSAKQVACSTAALLVACKVKADITSQAMKRLQHAGNAIKRATDALVRSAQKAVEGGEEDQFLELNTKFVGSMAQEIMLREEILRKERELKAAQAAYNAVKKARYHRDEGGSSPASVSSCSTNTNNTSTTKTSEVKLMINGGLITNDSNENRPNEN